MSYWYRLRERRGIWITSSRPVNWKGWLHLVATIAAFFAAISQTLGGGMFPGHQDLALIGSALIFGGLAILGLLKTKIEQDFSS